jgi:hypothetical protein
MGKKHETKHKKAQAYTLQTEIVKQLLNYLSTPQAFRAGQKKHLNKFMELHNTKSYTSLWNYEKIDGFQDELIRRKANFVEQEKLDMLERGKAGLKEISIKHKLKREVIDNKCQKREIEEEQDPNRQACERLIQLGGGDISDTVNVNGLEALQTAARKASEVNK